MTHLYIAFQEQRILPSLQDACLLDSATDDIISVNHSLRMPDIQWINEVMEKNIDNKFVQLKIGEYLSAGYRDKQLTNRQQAYFNLLLGIYNFPKMLLITDNFLRYIEIHEIEKITANLDIWLFICSFPKSEFASRMLADQQCIVETEQGEFRATIAKHFSTILNKPRRKHYETAIEFDEDF